MTLATTHRRRVEPQAQLPFKGESFPDYVVHRAPSSLQTKTAQDEPIRGSVEVIAAQSMHPSPVCCQSRASITEASPSVVSTASSAIACSPVTPQKRSTVQSSPVARHPRISHRPSLADQLKAISQNAQDVTARLKTSYNIQDGSNSAVSALAARSSTASSPGFQATTVKMTVGRLDCRFPCPATFGHDHCAYLFQHPFETKEIQMIMYYRDMVDVSVAPRDKCFRFRIDRALHQFGDDYNPSNPQHWIKIVFATASDTDKVKQFFAQRRRSFTSGNHRN